MGLWGNVLGGLAGAFGGVAGVGLPQMAAAAFGGGLDFLGAESDRRSIDESNRLNRLSTEQGNAQSMALARENMEMQREFAKFGIRWRAEDAAAAGLHPMAALGASGAQASPAYATFNAPSYQPSSKGDSWRSLSNMGQNIGRAVMATQTAQERAYEALRLVNMQKQNDLIDAQASLARAEALQLGKGPAMPATGQWMVNRDGSKSWVPSNEYAVAANALPFAGLSWFMRNKLMPNISSRTPKDWRQYQQDHWKD